MIILKKVTIIKLKNDYHSLRYQRTLKEGRSYEIMHVSNFPGNEYFSISAEGDKIFFNYKKGDYRKYVWDWFYQPKEMRPKKLKTIL